MRPLEHLLEMEQKVLIIEEVVVEVLRHEKNLKKYISVLINILFFIFTVHLFRF
jgi:hypothetical protein